ncbi:MAG TPA: AarF/UbiB family protein [Acidimicrobiales bacterium]|jgi:ubiquinone biosynthesis protein
MVYAAEVNLDVWGLLLYGVPFIIIAGWFSSRILGIKRGWGRSVIAGLCGWIFGVLIAAVAQDANVRSTGDLNHILALSFFFGVLVSMFVSLTLEIILKPRVARRRRFGPILHPIATLRRRLAPLSRSREILRYARKRGVTDLRYTSTAKLATPEFARRLRLMLEDCGGMFVKFGQIASTRSDLLPEALTTELAQLQSSARPVSADAVRGVLEAELGATVEEEFASFDFEPLAAASIGQTHRAVLKNGEKVVVKVQRPGIEDVVYRDAAVLRLVAGVVERRVDGARQIGVKRLANELIASLQRELDYGAEAAAGVAFIEHLEDEDGVAAPRVYQELSTRRVLVMEEIDGVSVAKRDAVAASPVPAPTLANRLLESFLDQILRDGMYHADPHPGNIFVDRSGVLWFLDFGAVGRLDPMLLETLQEMAIGFQMNDPVILARATRRMAGGDDTGDSRALEADIGLVLTEGMTSASFDPKAMTMILDIMGRHGLEVPTSMTVLSRALLTLEGTLRTIDPGFNIATEVNALLPAFAEQQQDAVQAQLQKEFLRALPSLRAMPSHVESIAAQLRTGRLRLRLERYAGADRAVVGAWIDRVLFAAIGMFGLLSSAVLLVAAGAVGEAVEGARDTLLILGFFGLIIGSVMLMRSVAQLLRDESASAGGRRV